MTYAKGTTVVLAGTKRGLFVLSSKDRREWDVDTTSLRGTRVFWAELDQRAGRQRMFAADNGDFFGSYARYSDDFGATWHEPEKGIRFEQGGGRKLANIWTIEPGRDEEPDTVYAGVDPASLWVSHDAGVSWDEVPGLQEHPTRERWMPGGGGLCLHSIVPDYSSSSRMWVGISAVGVLRSEDGGANWTMANKGTRAADQPVEYPEFGQCVHRLAQHPTQPDVLYQQNHVGVYLSRDAGNEWTEITEGLPSDFGFPLALDANNPETLFVVEEDFEAGRANFGDQFTVHRTQDAGKTWEPLTKGLPSGPGVRLGVWRHAMCTDTHDPCGVYVGTNTGQIFASDDRGETWQVAADFLPPVFSVSAAVIG